ncbi:MAG: DUF4231 domain-containing protein, partial [Leptolyngbyaceae cyanobacterium MAG.088]|nr:DUF4231 domain-containing protein [Leptolyngbyaceae cyanobacterium MAG.088]
MSQENLSADTPDRNLLNFAWQRHNVYSKNASRYRTRFSFLRNVLLILSVVIVTLSVAHASLSKMQETLQYTSGILRHSLIILPITISALLAFAIKHDRGNNWLLLRGSAEVLKSEIYCYCPYIREYKDNRDEVLAHKIKVISERLKGSAVHQAALNPYEDETPARYKLGWILTIIVLVIRLINKLWKTFWNQLFGIEKQTSRQSVRDDGFSDLTVKDYLHFRLRDQFFWYRNKSQQLDRQLQVLEGGIYFFGGLGTFLAAVGHQSWVAVTV